MAKTKLNLVGVDYLVGADCNAFEIIARAKRAADKAKWSPAKWWRYYRKAMFERKSDLDDYDHLLRVTMEYF